MGHYRQVQYRIRDRQALANWVLSRLVARCPTARAPKGSRLAAARVCEIPPQVLARLCQAQKPGITFETVDKLRGGAVQLRAAGESAGQVIGELQALLEEPPGADLWRGPRQGVRSGRRFVPAEPAGLHHLFERHGVEVQTQRWIRAATMSAKVRADLYKGVLPANAWVEIPQSGAKYFLQALTKTYGKGLLLMRRAARQPVANLERVPGVRQGWTGVVSGGPRGALYASFFDVPHLLKRKRT